MNPQQSPPSDTHLFDIPRLCGYFSERSPQPMVAVEGSGHIIRYLNAAFARLSGRAADELRGRSFAEIVPGITLGGCMALLDSVLQTGAPAHLAEQEIRLAMPAHWSFSMWPIVGADEHPVGVMIQVTDVTEVALFRRQARAINEALVVSSVRQHEMIHTITKGENDRRALEAQMFQAQKLESLGVMAGGIAHDLNNMLTPVLGFAELAADSLPAESPAVPMLKHVQTNARRAADLVEQILAFAGKGRFVVQLVDLSELVREMSALLEAAVSSHARLDYDLLPALPPVEADKTQLYQVILNLVTNAAEAIAETHGVITIRTGLQATEPKAQAPSPPAVFLEVSDTGCGIAADVIEKIYDPFFTTKFTGRGLGLAVVQGIARGHGGRLEVRSELGKGSAFRLIFPHSTKLLPPPIAARPATAWVGSGTILVIDDEPMIINLLSLVLDLAHFTVRVAPNGTAGLKVFREKPEAIAAVILDLTMPDMGGLEVAAALRQTRPNVPIILMSGYSLDEVTHKCAGLSIAAFVQKPFESAKILAAVRRALGEDEVALPPNGVRNAP